MPQNIAQIVKRSILFKSLIFLVILFSKKEKGNLKGMMDVITLATP